MDQPTTQVLDTALGLLNAGKTEEAATLLARTLAQDPGNERAWHMLSYALVDRKKQIYALRRVLDINPDNRAAKSRLGQLCAVDTPPAILTPAPSAQKRTMREEGTGAVPPVSVAASPKAREPSANPAMSLAWAERWRQAQQTGVQVTAAVPGGKIIPFPGTEPLPKLRRSPWQRFKTRMWLTSRRLKVDWLVFSQSKLAVLGVIIIVTFGILALLHPILIRTVWPRAIYDPVTGFDLEVFPHPALPSSRHLLGTDTLGRDVLSMLLAATTPTFVVGLTAALTTAIIGTTLSVLAAYFRGPVDTVITNMADVFLLFPAPIIMVIIGARFRDLSPFALGFIYGLVTGAGPTVIVMRAHALQVVSRPYMEAAKLAGGGSIHMMVKHMLPAMMPLAALQMMIAVTGAVVADGFISFFGLTRTVSNWGTLIYDAFVYGNIGATTEKLWWMLLPAAIFFSLFALGFYLVSRGLHRVASPTIREDQMA
jgi:peptide/nickel transport system permease protein